MHTRAHTYIHTRVHEYRYICIVNRAPMGDGYAPSGEVQGFSNFCSFYDRNQITRAPLCARARARATVLFLTRFSLTPTQFPLAVAAITRDSRARAPGFGVGEGGGGSRLYRLFRLTNAARDATRTRVQYGRRARTPPFVADVDARRG